MKAKEGDKVTVTKELHGHKFQIGSIVTLARINPVTGIHRFTNGSEEWYMEKTEFELYEQEGSEDKA